MKNVADSSLLIAWANQMAAMAWGELTSWYLLDFGGPDEDFVTRRLVQETARWPAPSAFLAGQRPAPPEGKTGADLEVWFADSRGEGFCWRIQAKRLYHEPTSPCVYKGVGRKIGKSPRRQIDALIDGSTQARLGPWYWFYNYATEPCGCAVYSLRCGMANSCAACSHVHHARVETGVLVVPAARVLALLGERQDLTFGDTTPEAFHLRCLFPDSQRRLRPTVAALSNHLWNLERLSRPQLRQDEPQGRRIGPGDQQQGAEPSAVVSAFTGLQVRDGEPVPGEVPDFVRSLTAQRPESRPNQIAEHLADRNLTAMIVVPLRARGGRRRGS